MSQVLLREYCKFPVEMGLVGDAFIDTACLNVPKVRLHVGSGAPWWSASRPRINLYLDGAAIHRVPTAQFAVPQWPVQIESAIQRLSQ